MAVRTDYIHYEIFNPQYCKLYIFVVRYSSHSSTIQSCLLSSMYIHSWHTLVHASHILNDLVVFCNLFPLFQWNSAIETDISSIWVYFSSIWVEFSSLISNFQFHMKYCSHNAHIKIWLPVLSFWVCLVWHSDWICKQKLRKSENKVMVVLSELLWNVIYNDEDRRLFCWSIFIS